MFCPITELELNVETCPTRRCMYKGFDGRCNHEELTSENVDVASVAKARAMKVYLVKSSANSAKQQVKMGMIVGKYASYIQDSFPARPVGDLVNKKREDNHVGRVLHRVFRLSTAQQEKFWDNERFSEWASRANLNVTLSDIRQALMASSPV